MAIILTDSMTSINIKIPVFVTFFTIYTKWSITQSTICRTRLTNINTTVYMLWIIFIVTFITFVNTYTNITMYITVRITIINNMCIII
jgi:hypothetical protein